jgi:hypothetical protein
MRVISVDPGKTTGYCYAAFDKGKLYFAPFQMFDDVDDFWDRLAAFKPEHVIIESFQYRKGGRTNAGLDLFPVQLIGVARLYEVKANVKLYLQTPSQGKGYYTDRTLKQLGLYQRGEEHGRDASRHLLQWATFGAGYKFSDGTRNFATLVKKEVFSG